MPVREKFSTQVNTQTMEAVRQIAAAEGRQLQSLVEEAFTDLVEKHKAGRPRPQVIAAYLQSVEKYDLLYKKLAQ